MKSQKKLLLIITILFVAIFTRFHNLENFFTEIDDQIAISETLIYDNLDLYDVAKDTDSSSYNSKIKKYLRDLESKDNDLINFTQKKVSSLLFNLAPSKTSTYAPLQYFMFGWILNVELNYADLKFYSRLPSAIFSILTIVITYLICRKVFENKTFFLFFPSLILTFSYPMIFISQRSYNYSAGVFAITLLFYLFLRENINLDNKKVFIDNDKIRLKKNFYFSSLLGITSYLTYLSIILMPAFFMFKFIKNYFDNKKIFTKSNFNLLICGSMYSVMILPLLIYMLKLNLQNYGATDSSGIFGEYSIIGKEGNYIKFYLYNFYLIVSKNLSFFLDNFFVSNIMQSLIFVITLFGIINIFKIKINKINNTILSLFFFILFYWMVFVFFNKTTFGPTRHLLWLTPIISIIFTLGIQNINNLFFKSNYIFLFIIIILTSSIFAFNYLNFINYHKDLLSEKELNNLIKKYNIQYLAPEVTVPQICYMSSIKIRIKTCPIRYYRYSNVEKLNKDIYRNVKSNSGSIAFINYDIKDKLQVDLKNNGFEKILTINDTRYLFNASPLYIAKQVPNFIKIEIFK